MKITFINCIFYVKGKEGGWIRHVNCLYRRTDKALIFNTYVSTNLIMFRTFRISICNPGFDMFSTWNI